MQWVDYEKLADNRAGQTSADMRKRVTAAREVQRKRFAHVPRPKGASPLYINADMGVTEIRGNCVADPAGQSLQPAANLSAAQHDDKTQWPDDFTPPPDARKVAE